MDVTVRIAIMEIANAIKQITCMISTTYGNGDTNVDLRERLNRIYDRMAEIETW